jgi:ditrans,polycis-polyprenyl diphosphate synthase
MTTAIRRTVEEYSQTPRPHSTPFSQSRITQKILSKQAGAAPDVLESISESPSTPGSDDHDHDHDHDHDDAVSTATTLHSSDSTTALKSGLDGERDEIGSAVEDSDSSKDASSRAGVAIYPNPETITPETIEKHLYTAGCPPLDIFVRTSGVERLSDYMLWQCHQDTHIFFLKCLWPEFDLWHFLPVLVEWQWRQKQKARDERPRRRLKQE